MSAAPALPRPSGKAQLPKRWWIAMDQFFIDELCQRLYGRRLEYVICLKIHSKTAGAPPDEHGNRPQRALIKHEEFAHSGYGTVDGVAKAIKHLQTGYTDENGQPLPLIGCHRVGRQNEYWLIVENCKRLIAPPEPAEADPTSEIEEIRPRIPAKIYAKVCKDCRPLFAVVGDDENSSDTTQSNQEDGEKHLDCSTGIDGSKNGRTSGENCSRSVQNGKQPHNAGVMTPPEQGGTEGEEEVRKLLVLHLTRRLGSAPPAELCQSIAQILTGVPLELFKNRLELRKHKVTAWGMVAELARDAQKAHKEIEKQRASVEAQQERWREQQAAEQRKESLQTLGKMIRAGDEDNARWLAGDDQELLTEARELARKGTGR